MRLYLLLIPLLLLSSCDRRTEREMEKLQNTVSQFIDDANKKLSDITPSSDQLSKMTEDEITALFALEYRVVEISPQTPTAELQALMTSLGNDRWDCFNMLTSPDRARIFCKRQPGTALRYWTKFHSLFY